MRTLPTLAERIVDVAGRRVQLLEGGNGKPLLFLHGGDGTLARLGPVVAPLAGDFRVIAPLHPGFGASELPKGWSAVDDLVFHYLDLLDALGLAEAAIVGHSLGGWIAAELAVLQPRRLTSLVLVDALGIRVEGIALPNPFMMPSAKAAELLYGDAAVRAAALPQTPEDGLRRLRDREVNARFTFTSLYDPKLFGRLHRVAAPTLVLWGARDALLPLDYGRAYAAAIRGARFATLDCGHSVPFERPAEFVRAVGDFITAGG